MSMQSRVPPPDGYVPYVHTRGQTACGYLAFFVRADVESGTTLQATDLRPADRGLARAWQASRCTTCRAPLPLPIPTPDGRPEVDV